MSELVTLVAVACAVSGAICSSIKGWWEAPEEEKFSKRKVGAAIMVAVFSGFGMVNFPILAEQIQGMNLVALGVMYLILGFGIDQAKS